VLQIRRSNSLAACSRIVWGVTGAARACLEAAVDCARTREQFGEPIGGFQLTQSKLA